MLQHRLRDLCKSEEGSARSSMPNVELHMLAKLALAWNSCSLWPRQIVEHQIRSFG
jgi:hypothetical protein